MTDSASFPAERIRTRRKITGMSAILLPFTDQGDIDWDGFDAHVTRTADAGLTPAVNMDTGYVNLLDDATREAVLDHTRAALGDRAFVAGAYVGDNPGTKWNADAYQRQTDAIQDRGGIPVIFQSYGLVSQPPSAIIDSYGEIGQFCPQFIAFELGTMFAPFGKIYDLDTYRGLLEIPQCLGAKHSSLSRELEWQRLQLRDDLRPDFKVLTGNDLAIDMVMYGSDYLLGLSTFAPDLFAQRDALWEAGDAAFYELNDLLQYLGFFAFRSPVPAYKHSAAQFLKLQGWITSDATHPNSPARPQSDVAILRNIAERLSSLATSPIRAEAAP
ncbi:MAG: dihydrodipicolinate synthase family protein [Chloroflexi bacterium]|nr:dihydrodipicolinate synthase family protein [Chloroflexota bacterium]